MVTKNVCAFVVLLVLAGFTGCGSPYSAEYKIVTDGNNAYVETTIKGPAAKLAVILTGPSEKSETAIVEKNQMISNCQTARCNMQDLQEGKWVLTVKTVDPEKVVWQKDIALSLGQLTVKDVSFGISPFNGWTGDSFCGYEITGIRLVLKNTGNMPIAFTDNSFTLRNKKSSGFFAASVHIGPELLLNMTTPGFVLNSNQVFKPGERYMVKGLLCYNDNKSLNFEKEIVFPSNRP